MPRLPEAWKFTNDHNSAYEDYSFPAAIFPAGEAPGYPLRQRLCPSVIIGGCGGFRWSPPRSHNHWPATAPCLRSYPLPKVMETKKETAKNYGLLLF